MLFFRRYAGTDWRERPRGLGKTEEDEKEQPRETVAERERVRALL